MATLTLDTAAAAPNLGYYQPGDTIRLASNGQLATVVNINIAGGFQTVDIQRIDGAAWTTTTLPVVGVNNAIGHVFSAFAEGSNGPAGRLFLPVEDFNYTQILKRAMKVTGSEMSNKTILGDGRAWYFTVEEILLKEFARDREILLMFGQKASANSIKYTRGIYDWVSTLGIVTTYSSAVGVAESDLQNHIAALLPQGGSAEYLALCGSTYLSKVMAALKDYKIFNSTQGSLGEKMAGLDFHGYAFAGKTVYFAYYELFDDPAILPFIGTPSATTVNFKDFSLWLDMGTDSAGQKLITLKYKALNGIQRKFVHKVIPGMMAFDSTGADSGFAANSFDGVEVQLLSEIGVKLLLPNRMGIMRAAS